MGCSALFLRPGAARAAGLAFCQDTDVIGEKGCGCRLFLPLDADALPDVEMRSFKRKAGDASATRSENCRRDNDSMSPSPEVAK